MLTETINAVKDTLTVTRVFGEPIEKDGVTIIPAASVAGGGGGGSGHDASGQEGEGGGFGLRAKPAGVYVIRDGTAYWRPAIDANLVIAATVAVVITCIVGRVRLVRHSGGRRRR